MYEVVAGHNRIQAFQELGRTSISTIVMAMDDDRANLSAFYSNLLAPSLPDYEKFKGFQVLAARFKKSQQEMAKEAGMSKSSLSKIFAYEKLPIAVLELLDNATDKGILGSEAASKLAGLTEQGRGKRVVEAVQKLITEKIGQGAAVAYASQSEVAKPDRPEPIDIAFGKQKKWCSITRTAKDVRLSFAKDESVDEQLVTDLVAFLKARTQGTG